MEKNVIHTVSQSYALRVQEDRRILLRPELCLVTPPVFINAALGLSVPPVGPEWLSVLLHFIG